MCVKYYFSFHCIFMLHFMNITYQVSCFYIAIVKVYNVKPLNIILMSSIRGEMELCV